MDALREHALALSNSNTFSNQLKFGGEGVCLRVGMHGIPNGRIHHPLSSPGRRGPKSAEQQGAKTQSEIKYLALTLTDEQKLSLSVSGIELLTLMSV